MHCLLLQFIIAELIPYMVAYCPPCSPVSPISLHLLSPPPPPSPARLQEGIYSSLQHVQECCKILVSLQPTTEVRGV